MSAPLRRWPSWALLAMDLIDNERAARDLPVVPTSMTFDEVVTAGPAWTKAYGSSAAGHYQFMRNTLDAPRTLEDIKGEMRLTGSERFDAALQDVRSAVVDAALGGWGTPAATFPPQVRAAYVEALRDPAHAHAICEEYRAAAGVDREHDAADRAAGRKIAAPVLALWSAPGPLGSWYAAEGGPLALWRDWADDVRGRPIDGGHFFPEERPEETAILLADFFGEA